MDQILFRKVHLIGFSRGVSIYQNKFLISARFPYMKSENVLSDHKKIHNYEFAIVFRCRIQIYSPKMTALD